MPRRMSVWPVAIQTLTLLGIGIIVALKWQAPAPRGHIDAGVDDDATIRPDLYLHAAARRCGGNRPRRICHDHRPR